MIYTDIDVIRRLYSVIYADPPWKYKHKKRGSAVSHYKTMDVEEIAAMNVKRIAAPNSILFMWIPWTHLAQGAHITVMQAWGYIPLTLGFIWFKTNKNKDSLFWGTGTWTRANTEACFIGVRGNPRRYDRGIHQVLTSRIREHSEKPDEVRDAIYALLQDVPRIELFSRKEVMGWDAFGNQVKPLEAVA